MEKTQEVNTETPTTTDSKWKKWLKRVGVAGFMFFLIKGLIWLAIFYYGGKAIF